MITLQGKYVSVAEMWFQPPTSSVKGFDILDLRQVESPPEHARCHQFSTLLFDLTRTEDELFSDISKGTASKIRRARDRDGIEVYSYERDDDALLRFAEFYAEFARSKGMSPVSFTYLKACLEAGELVLREARFSEQDETIVWHSYIASSGRARLLHSSSLFRNSNDSSFRNLVGRANRFLHWDDMLWFKTKGFTTYDLGGWYTGSEDQAKLAINRFKEDFGGRAVTEYNCRKPLTLKGSLYLLSRRLRGKD
ncbi:hypothetical protein [Sediminispirochaeta bajacaliforniensis]|uniref:hypothetical protein n=1 Tax=Sediminispirochaeta bajacaliforniensis TaxID=148 RepID=UPI0003665FAC|nr:hypothetical protein [Sediminispirochaeta bajacaliforniensis]